MTSKHPDKAERLKEETERLTKAAKSEEGRRMYEMAVAVARVKTVSKLEVKYGMGSVNRANVKPDPMEILNVMGWLTLFVGCGMTLPEKPGDFFANIRSEGGIGDALAGNILKMAGVEVSEDEIHKMHMEGFGGGE